MKHTMVDAAAQDYPRLPCRGCTAQCPDYATCQGRPWHVDAVAADGAAQGNDSALAVTSAAGQ